MKFDRIRESDCQPNVYVKFQLNPALFAKNNFFEKQKLDFLHNN